MFEWWAVFWYCTLFGVLMGANFGGPTGAFWGGVIGFAIGALPPSGPGPLKFDPNDI